MCRIIKCISTRKSKNRKEDEGEIDRKEEIGTSEAQSRIKKRKENGLKGKREEVKSK